MVPLSVSDTGIPSLFIIAMQVLDVLRNNLGCEILPRAASNAIAGINGWRTACRLGA
jgi:hypothetical protein